MATCRLLLIGPPRIEKDGRSLPIALRKAVALAAYLAVERRVFSRERLATLLWPDHGQESALSNLRRTLSLLRGRFGNGCISVEADQLQMDHGCVEVDVHEFQSLLGSPVSASDPSSLERAAVLYRGDFMEGFSLGDCEEFDEWQDATRERLRAEYDSVLETLTTAYLRDGQLDRSLEVAQRWLDQDHLNEAAHRALMEIHARAGRTDRAHRQYQACVRILREERLEPDKVTRELIEAIEAHRIAPAPVDSQTAAPGTSVLNSRRRTRRTLVRIAAAVLLAAATTVSVLVFRWLLAQSDLSVSGLEVYQSGNELSAVRVALRNEGFAKRSVDYTVVLSSDATVMSARDYVIYAGAMPMRRDAEVTIELDRWRDMEPYVRGRALTIPPGEYTLSAVIDPDGFVAERSEFNNRLTRGTRFFYPGTAADAAFAVDISYAGPGPLDYANPLKVFIGPRSYPSDSWDWGRFVVTRPGRYYLPLEDIPRRDRDGTGYFLVIVHDTGNDLDFPLLPERDDLAAIYREGPGNLTYGVFGVAIGTPVYPGGRYAVTFAPPPKPGPDAYELDDHEELGTVIDYDALPVRQRHTFHSEGTGDVDADWFRILLRAGETLTVETFSAGGSWECDTAINIADGQVTYIRNAVDKSDDDVYSRLTYRNDTGIDQVFRILVKPYRKYDRAVNVVCEYIVEFRR